MIFFREFIFGYGIQYPQSIKIDWHYSWKESEYTMCDYRGEPDSNCQYGTIFAIKAIDTFTGSKYYLDRCAEHRRLFNRRINKIKRILYQIFALFQRQIDPDCAAHIITLYLKKN